ncbi:hypothetical protein [Streptomyces sp. Tu 3180]|uniref:hypothetical protein n=1 Tax=Streptomyces sp. Tu 3180 TaxID=2682611 RepID=UPI001356D17D|nr:hypothetical protein [Streptomyces sp. Tu 3180]KAF3470008.1 hypothetical protein GL259_00360 [Streptomyces sp. Tu 3180]
MAQRKQRPIELITQARPTGPAGDEITLSHEEWRTALEDPGTLQAVQQKIAEVEAATRQRLQRAAAALDAPLPDSLQTSRPSRPGGNAAARQAQTPTPPPPRGFRP